MVRTERSYYVLKSTLDYRKISIVVYYVVVIVLADIPPGYIICICRSLLLLNKIIAVVIISGIYRFQSLLPCSSQLIR
jgi:hypothetical protein